MAKVSIQKGQADPKTGLDNQLLHRPTTKGNLTILIQAIVYLLYTAQKT